MLRRSTTRLCFACLTAVSLAPGEAVGFVPPADAVVNVLDFGATPDDPSDDDSVAFNAAMAAAIEGTLFVPNGVYHVDGQINWDAGGSEAKRKTLLGESREGAVIKLRDSAPGFGDANSPVAVLQPVDSAVGSTATAFGNQLKNMTVDVGAANPGAIGVQWHNNNQGGIEGVRIVSTDAGRAGVAGLRMTRSWPGPGLIRDIEIEGFDRGVEFGNGQYSMTFEDVTLRNQNLVGFQLQGNMASIRNLKSVNSVPAVQASGVFSFLSLDTASLTGGASGQSGIVLEGAPAPGALIRNVSAEGYDTALVHHGAPLASLSVDEYVTYQRRTLFDDTPAQGLNLPVRDTPDVPLAPAAQWVSALDFGAIPNDGLDDSLAIQRAIDSMSDPLHANFGKSTLYFPRSNIGPAEYVVNEQVILHGKVERLIGYGSRLGLTGDAQAQYLNGSKPVLVTHGLESDALVIEQFGNGGTTGVNMIRHEDDADLILKKLRFGGFTNGAAAGDVFIEDVAGSDWVFTNGVHVFARQLNSEDAFDPQVINDGAVVWILGMKTERQQTAIITRNGGMTELLGGFIYPLDGVDEATPAFVVEDSQASLSFLVNAFQFADNYAVYVEETQNGDTRTLRFQAPDVFPRGTGGMVPLYVSSGMVPEPSSTLLGGLFGMIALMSRLSVIRG